MTEGTRHSTPALAPRKSIATRELWLEFTAVTQQLFFLLNLHPISHLVPFCSPPHAEGSHSGSAVRVPGRMAPVGKESWGQSVAGRKAQQARVDLCPAVLKENGQNKQRTLLTMPRVPDETEILCAEAVTAVRQLQA